MLYITSVFSPNMMDKKQRPILQTHEISLESARDILKEKKNSKIKGEIGHRDTADFLEAYLDIDWLDNSILFGRSNLKLKITDSVLSFLPQHRDLLSLKEGDLPFRIFYSQLV